MPKKVDRFANERNEILHKLLNILEISETNKILSLKILDNNPEKQQQIINLVPEIQKYFICSKWTYFSNKKRDIKRTYLSLIKAIIRDLNINMTTTTAIKRDENNIIHRETYYVFEN